MAATTGLINLSDEQNRLLANRIREVVNADDIGAASEYRGQPIRFIREILGAEPTSYQQEIIEALFENRRLAVRSPHGAGKTTLASWIVLYGLSTFDEDYKIITTASAWRQLQFYLWPELHKWFRKADWDALGFHPDVLQLKATTSLGEAFAVASDNHEFIEGAHASIILCVFDEAKAIPEATWDAMEGAFSSGTAYALAISTPGDRSGRFYDIHRHKPGYEDWKTRHIKLHEAVDAGQIDEDWVQARRRQWGEDSPVFQARVLGEFPDQSDDSLVSLAWVESAMERGRRSCAWVPGAEVWIGIDVARYGSDDSAAVVRRGNHIIHVETWHGNDTMQTAGRAVELMRRFNGSLIVDDDGLGGGVQDRLRELGHKSIPFKGGEQARDSEHFKNKRAEAYWNLRVLLEREEVTIGEIQEADRLSGELTGLKFHYTSKGQIQLESKDKMKRDGLNSPDVADAMAMAFYSAGSKPQVY